MSFRIQEIKWSHIFFALAVIIGAWFRFYHLELKPLHHDEGVNSHFLLNLANYGDYRYDPENYHGPTLYYFALLSLRLFGESEFALRFIPAIFGMLTIILIWPLRNHLGPAGVVVAAYCMALSPGLVYFSRDFIHEMAFGCFSMGVVTGAWRFAETKQFPWLLLLAGSAGLLFATKETAIITAVVLLIAIICASLWDNLNRLYSELNLTAYSLFDKLRRDAWAISPTLDYALAASLIFLFINFIFYTSFFTHLGGAYDTVRSVWLWAQRSGSEHVKSFSYYLGILLKLELPMLIGALIGAGFVIRRGTRFWLFTAAWLLGMFLVYSIIGYKTPWLVISFLIPLTLMTGYAVQQLFQSFTSYPARLLLFVIIILTLSYNSKLSWTVNMVKYDDNSNHTAYFRNLGEMLNLTPYKDGQSGYVYAQTDRDILNFVKEIKDETAKMPLESKTGIYFASPDYWPLPWYLRDYINSVYTGKLEIPSGQTPAISQPVVVANANQQTQLNGFPDWRLIARPYILRPGVELVIYIRDQVGEIPR
ncbi:MAG: TIGR03663 family protein [Acidobacteria bacterium]|nr:TIGR03663 family protein [Acidobacteriota bacterium]